MGASHGMASLSTFSTTDMAATAAQPPALACPQQSFPMICMIYSLSSNAWCSEPTLTSSMCSSCSSNTSNYITMILVHWSSINKFSVEASPPVRTFRDVFAVSSLKEASLFSFLWLAALAVPKIKMLWKFKEMLEANKRPKYRTGDQ